MLATNLVGRRCWKRRGHTSRDYFIAAVCLDNSFRPYIVLEDAQTGDLQMIDFESIRVQPLAQDQPVPDARPVPAALVQSEAVSRVPIISLTPGKEEMIARAKQLANTHKEAQGVWEHVGLYGRPDGDIPARHTFRVQSLNKPDPPDEWALIACIDQDGV